MVTRRARHGQAPASLPPLPSAPAAPVLAQTTFPAQDAQDTPTISDSYCKASALGFPLPGMPLPKPLRSELLLVTQGAAQTMPLKTCPLATLSKEPSHILVSCLYYIHSTHRYLKLY